MKGLPRIYFKLQCRLQRRLRPIYCDPQDHTLLVLVELPGGLLGIPIQEPFCMCIKQNYSHSCALV